MALMNYNHDNYTPEELPEYTPPEPAPKSRFRRFFPILAILALLFLSTAVILFFYGSRLVANQQNMAVRLNAEHTATIMAAVNSTLAAVNQPVLPVESLTPTLENTPVEANTNTPVVNTNTPVPTFTWTPELTETAIVAALQTEIATQMPLLSGTFEATPTVQDAAETETIPVATDKETTPVVETPTLQPEPSATKEAPTVEPTEAEPTTNTQVETLASTYTPAPTETLDSSLALEATPTQEPTLPPMSTENPLPTFTPLPTETVAEPIVTETLEPLSEVLTQTPTAEVTALPDTGFADDYGLPFFGLAALGLILLVLVVRLARFVSR